MRKRTGRHFGRISGPATILLAGLALNGLLVGPLRAQPPVSPSREEPEVELPDREIRMGNTGGMQMGRDAAGNVRMEMRSPQKDAASQPQVGPFFIYPQVDMPGGRHQGGPGMGHPGGRSQGTGQGGSGLMPGGRGGQMGQTGQSGPSGQTGAAGSSGQAGQGGTSGQTSPSTGQTQSTTPATTTTTGSGS